MAGEIEKHLLEKLARATKEAGSKDQYLSDKLFHLHSHFRKLKALLENRVSPSSSSSVADESIRIEKLYYLNNVLNEWQMISKTVGLYSPDALAYAYNLSRSLKKIKREIKRGDSSSALQRYHTPQNNVGINLSEESKTYRWSSRFVDPNKVRGFEEKVLLIEKLISQPEKNERFKAIGVTGMRGIGKTTLSQVIFRHPNVKEHFFPRIWVCMSEQPEEDIDNRSEIVKRMLNCLGVEEETTKSAEESHGLSGLLFALRIRLSGKKYLIVLDDAWSSDKFFENLGSREDKCVEKLSYGLPKENGVGAVIVTSRNKEIAKNMVGDEENIYPLPLSDHESSWFIFKDSVQEDGAEFPQDLEILKQEIVDNCAGLPLSAKMMGEIMREQLHNSPAVNRNHQP